METSKEEKFYEFLCHLLYKLDNIRIDPVRLKSTDSENPCPQAILDLLNTERYQRYIEAFEKNVIFIDNIRNPTGINKYLREYALNPENGTLHTKDIVVTDHETGLEKTINVVDYYEPTDPDEVRIVIQDNFSNLTLESGMNKMQNIDRLSKYNIILRDQLDYTIVAIQHQSQSQEGIENFKLGKLKPSSDGLADCKTTIRDTNIALGLFSPYKFEIENYNRYDITRFKNHIRFMEIIENRNGDSGRVCPLFFDGAVSYFEELPLPTEQGINDWYTYVSNIRNRTVEGDLAKLATRSHSLFFTYTSNKTIKIRSKFNILYNKLKKVFKWQ